MSTPLTREQVENMGRHLRNAVNRDGAHWFQVARNHEDTIAALRQRVKELEAALKAIQGVQMQWSTGPHTVTPTPRVENEETTWKKASQD